MLGLRTSPSAAREVTINAIKKQDAAAQRLALMNGLEGAGGIEICGADQQFGEVRFDLLHGGDEHDAAAIDEDDVR